MLSGAEPVLAGGLNKTMPGAPKTFWGFLRGVKKFPKKNNSVSGEKIFPKTKIVKPPMFLIL